RYAGAPLANGGSGRVVVHGIDAAHELNRGRCLLPDPAEAIQSDFWRETPGTPKGSSRKAQGASPGNKQSNNGSPKGRRSSAGIKAVAFMTNIYLEFETEPLRRPFRALCNLDF